jgi:hypothetical protein
VIRLLDFLRRRCARDAEQVVQAALPLWCHCRQSSAEWRNRWRGREGTKCAESSDDVS